MELEIDFNSLEFDEDFITALAKIMAYMAGKIDASVQDNQHLQDILGTFQDKIREQDRATLEPLLTIASDLETVVMLNIISASITKINSRNAQLNALAKRLGTQIKAANLDATALKRITTEIDKVTNIVKEAKKAAETAANPDLTLIAKLKAVLDSLTNIQKAFKPQEA